MTGITAESGSGRDIRQLIRQAGSAALGTVDDIGRPLVSLVEVASDMQGHPILLLSDLAQHSKNLAGSTKASLLVADEGPADTPLAGVRVSLVGQVQPCDDEYARNRYMARLPHARDYAAMGDFKFYRFSLDKAHLVAGFGRIEWVDGADILFPPHAVSALAAAEAGIVDHMNDDHADAIGLYATVLLEQPAGDWTMTGLDPEGADLCCDRTTIRLPFESPIDNAKAARDMFVSLVKTARLQSR